MQPTSRLTRSLLGAAMVLTLALPASSFAITSPEPPVSTSPAPATFCTNLPNKVTAAGNRITALENTLKSDQQKHLSTLQTNWGNWDTKLAGLRAEWQQDRDKEYAQLMALATTQTEKDAVTVFESTTNAAITAREASNDTVRQTYRTNVLAALSTLNASENQAVVDMIAAFNTAVSTAQTKCAIKPVDNAAIRTAFTTALKTAQTNYKAAVKTDRTTFQTTVKQLQATRTAAEKANDQTSHTAIQAAMQTLLKAFGK